MNPHPLFILAVLGLLVAISEWLARRTALRHLGSALLVIVLTAIVANLGLIPTYSDDIPVYAGIFESVAPLAIFLLLLQVHLRGLVRAGPAMLMLFALGSVGTLVGVLVGMWIVGGSEAFGELHFALGGMFVGTYTGGSINFNAVALEYGVVKEPLLYAGAAAVDNVATTAWMAVTVALPRLLGRRGDPGVPAAAGPGTAGKTTALDSRAPATAAPQVTAPTEEPDRESVRPFDLAILLALGVATVWFAELASGWLETGAGIHVPSILILTTIALVLAQVGPVQRLHGARVTGWLAVMLFLAVIGALCDVAALREIGRLGRDLFVFVAAIVAVHGLVVFGVGRIVGADPAMAAVASQANIGGSTSALALARSLGRGDLLLPAILIGALGNGLGTYLGFLTAAWLH